MTLARAVLYNLGFTLWTLVLGILGLPLLLCGRRAVARLSLLWTRGSFAWLKLTVGLDHCITGREHLPEGPAIVALKHQSAWDTLLLNQLLADPAIVYKRELNWLPLVGWYIYACGMIPIDRQGGAPALRRMIAAARAAVAERRPIAIFPEGTRGAPGASLPYQPGVGALYAQLRLPLVPVALDSGRYWGRRAFMKRPGRIEVRILPPIPPELDRKEAMRVLRERIEGAG